MDKNPSFKNNKRFASITKNGFANKTANYGGIQESGFHDFYSPILSKDFLELPQNLKERRAWYRFFYSFNEMVRRSIDLHSELPLSRIRLAAPKCADADKAEYIQTFFQNMCDRISLFKKLLAFAHEYYLMGCCYFFLEDGSEAGSESDPLFSIDDDLQMPESAKAYRKKYDNKLPDYQGWERMQILPPDMVKISRWQFTDKIKAELVVPTDTANLIRQGGMSPEAEQEVDDIMREMPLDLRNSMETGDPLEFETDPYQGSHLVEILRKTGDYEEAGSSILDSCLRSLLLMDKYRQAQCFTGDTKIVLADGTEEEIQNLVELESFKVFSSTAEGKTVEGKGHSARITGYVDRLVELEINDVLVKCTPEHRFMLKDGSYKEAQFLGISEELMLIEKTKPRCIQSIQHIELDNKIPVYDITVDEFHNFCLSAGNFVHNSQIASRHMTPMRVVTAPKASYDEVEYLREQVDAALVDPDYSIIANFDIDWNEMGADGRVLSLGEEYAELEKRLSAGLGVTMGLLTGEATYGGERISLEIINTQYMLFREIVQDFVENNIFKPVALKKGFWEYDKFGNKKILIPTISFTRLALRDNDAVFNQLFDLYQKGSIPLSYILELLGLDPNAAKEEIERDMLTVNDSRFNDLINAISQPVADQIAENTDISKKIATYLKLKWNDEGGGEGEEGDPGEEERFK